MYNNELQINNPLGGDVDITSTTGQVKINGVVPGGRGGVTDPLNIGTVNASTKITTPSIQPPDTNTPLFIEANVIKAPVAGPAGLELVDVTSVTATGTISANSISSTTSVSGVSLSASTGDVTVGGAGNVRIQGTGKLISGVNGIDSNGEINTIGNNDIVSGRDIYFDGDDIYKRNNNPVQNINYKDYKQLAGLNDNNVFTGANQFDDNDNEFSEKVSIGTRDGAGIFTESIALNKSGNIECQTIQNVTSITTGTITCDNGGVNECKAKIFNTRTSGTNGWNIKQALEEANPPGNQANNILQIAATQAQAAGIPVEIYVTSSEYDPTNNDNPNIKLIPDTILNGGTIQASQYDLGTATNRFYLKQDIGGVNDKVLQIKAPTTNASVNFKDSVNADVLVVKNTAVELGNTIPISFGSYDFRPIQFYKDITAFSFNNSALGSTNLIFKTNDSDWINKNTGATGQNLSMPIAANQGAYKLGFAQIGAGSLGQINGLRFISDTVLTQANDNLPNVILPSASAYSFEAYDGTSAPVVTMSPGFLHYSVFAQFPGVSGSETSNVRITLTKMPFFA
jgi:hypothetical protein